MSREVVRTSEAGDGDRVTGGGLPASPLSAERDKLRKGPRKPPARVHHLCTRTHYAVAASTPRRKPAAPCRGRGACFTSDASSVASQALAFSWTRAHKLQGTNGGYSYNMETEKQARPAGHPVCSRASSLVVTTVRVVLRSRRPLGWERHDAARALVRSACIMPLKLRVGYRGNQRRGLPATVTFSRTDPRMLDPIHLFAECCPVRLGAARVLRLPQSETLRRSRQGPIQRGPE